MLQKPSGRWKSSGHDFHTLEGLGVSRLLHGDCHNPLRSKRKHVSDLSVRIRNSYFPAIEVETFRHRDCVPARLLIDIALHLSILPGSRRHRGRAFFLPAGLLFGTRFTPLDNDVARQAIRRCRHADNVRNARSSDRQGRAFDSATPLTWPLSRAAISLLHWPK
jgi:hypothetical protein